VNAAAIEYEITPHFRHPPGAAKDECVVLAARAAAVQGLQEMGEFRLPRRAVTARTKGLSGRDYEVTIEAPAQTVRVAESRMLDVATALLTLDDGSELVVELTGRVDGTALLSELSGMQLDGNALVPAAVVTVYLSDAVMATMDPQEIVARLRLLPDPRWCAHWDDAAMLRQAGYPARQQAIKAFDAVGSVRHGAAGAGARSS
jgi:hypothetical protein